MIRSDCIHLAGYEQYDERYCSHSSRCEFITTCAGCDLYERVMTPTDVLLLKVNELMDENAKLRELATRFADYVGQDRCEGCATKTRCNEGLMDECWLLTEIREMADGLGIEVVG